MKQITKLLESKKSVGALALLGCLIFTTYNIQENSNHLKRLTNFEGGIQTCFSRVNQTYTAKMINDSSSNYLTQNFQNLTEECFAEGILNIEDGFKVELSSIAKKLSTLASNVHWFHEDILSPGTGTSPKLAGDGEALDVGSRFEKIESTKDEILDSSEVYKSELSSELNKQKTIFYVTSTFLVLLMFSELITTTRKKLFNQIKEKEAEGELLENGGVASVKFGEIIRTALEQNDLINCSKLFSNYLAHNIYEKTSKNKAKFSLETLVTPLTGNSVSLINEKIDKTWNDDTVGVQLDKSPNPKTALNTDTLKDINLEHACSGVVDLLAEKLFSRGVKLDIKIPEKLMIKARSEELEQTLYHLLNYAINSTQSDGSARTITVFAHRLGSIVAFDLIHSGKGFDDEILKQRVGISQTTKKIDVDLQICQSLLEEIHGKIQIDNKLDQNGEITGGRVKIIFKSSERETKLVDLKVGSKKEILAGINAGTI